MTTLGKTDTITQERRPFDSDAPIPALLVADAPEGSVAVDRCIVKPSFTVGRGDGCSLTIKESKISNVHFKISHLSDGFYIEDSNSTNGTFLDGCLSEFKEPLRDGAVIRAGQSVLVFHKDARAIFEAANPVGRFGIVGRFHAAPFLRSLKEAVLTGRHLLIAGPSGAGKELTARATARLLGTPESPLPSTAHNAARFSSEEEAASTLFGVASRVFSNVDARPGLIETAGNGVLFLDEIHNLPIRVQRTLLRVIEEGRFSRIGETALRPTGVRFIFASNAPEPTYDLAPDLLARLMVLKVPSLGERVADIPNLFHHVLEKSLGRHGIPIKEPLKLLQGDHHESLCLDAFPESNVRGLVDLADRIAARIASGMPTDRAISTVFAERFKNSPVALRRTTNPSNRPKAAESSSLESTSNYERYKDIILAAYRDCNYNLSATERLLKSRGLRCTRRWLAVFLDKWGVRSEGGPAS